MTLQMDVEDIGVCLLAGDERRHTRAVLNARAGNMPEAIADLDRALRSEPGSAIARYNRGLALRASGRAAESASDLAAACRSGFKPACEWLP